MRRFRVHWTQGHTIGHTDVEATDQLDALRQVFALRGLVACATVSVETMTGRLA